MKVDIHHIDKSFMEYRSLVGTTVAVCIVENQNPVRFRTVIVVGSKVGMAFGDKYPPAPIDGQSGRRHDLRVLGKEFDFQTIVERTRRLFGQNLNGTWEKRDANKRRKGGKN